MNLTHEMVINKIFPPLRLRILFFLRLNYYQKKETSSEDLIKRFARTKSQISQNIKLLLQSGLARKEYLKKRSESKTRMKIMITKKGLLLADKFIFEGLTSIEKQTIKALKIQF